VWCVEFYRRNLPHWFPTGASIFLTWRLHGSLPAALLARMTEANKRSAGEDFRLADRALDRADSGPLWLKDPRVAASVVEKLHKGALELRHYDQHSYAVMANHIHVLLTPRIEVRKLMRALKGATARAANEVLGRTGERFWQDESFDHWVRNPAEFARIKSYIERNPVSAGLVSRPEDWRWSSAYRP
jgi:REP-associated tyrosine transposase